MHRYFKPHISLEDALFDSWSKGLPYAQVQREIEHDFGKHVTEGRWTSFCYKQDERMCKHFNKE